MHRLTARLYLLFTPQLCVASPRDTLKRALDGGVGLVQWRAVGSHDHPELESTLELCGQFNVPLIVNDDPALAVRVGAAGAHVGQTDMPAADARSILGPQRWLGVSTHDVIQIHQAQADGADHLGFGPCYPTETKGYSTGQRADQVRTAFAASQVPTFAIGGINADNVGELLDLGARRIAVCRSILCAPDPTAAAQRLTDALDKSPA